MVLTVLVVSGAMDQGEMELVRTALGTRNDLFTQAIWLLTFISSSVPALLLALAVSAYELAWSQPGALHRVLLVVRRPSLRHASRQGWLSVLRLLPCCWPALAYLGALVCNIALRVIVGRLRPDVDYIAHQLPELQADFQRFSYPSGHAGAALVAFGALAIALWHTRLRWPALACAVLVIAGTGFGRVYLGVHWPSDVLAGYLLGGVWLALAVPLRTRAGAPMPNDVDNPVHKTAPAK
jgi:membrane-associated phospholipid phosphatase